MALKTINHIKGDQWQEWMSEFQKESDRACAVLGPAFIYYQLKILLEEFFVDDAEHSAKLLGVSSPIGDFSARINLAFALGFLTKSELRDLGLIRRIRNEFAHELHGLNFLSDGIANRCLELEACESISYFSELTPRDRFVTSIVLLANWIALRRLGIRDTKRTTPRYKQILS